MSISRSSLTPLGDDEAFALCVLVRAVGAVVGAGVLGQIGPGGVGAWMAIGVGVALGIVAPAWGDRGIAAAAAVSLVAVGASGGEAPFFALAFPGAVVGSWLRPGQDPAQPVAWIDAMLIGAASEAVLVSSMAVTLIPAAVVAMPLALLGGEALGSVAGAVLMVAACGWTHVAYGRAIHRMLPGRFGGFAVGQVLPISLLALTGGEPLVLLIVVARAICLWWGHRLAEGEEVESEPAPRITVSPGRRRAGTFW